VSAYSAYIAPLIPPAPRGGRRHSVDAREVLNAIFAIYYVQAAIPPAGADLAAGNARLRRENERLRMEREIQKKAAHFLERAEMKFRLIADQRESPQFASCAI
jgi:transposase-like protein